MNKKAVELSLNTVIIAIILLVVLVVVIGIFSGAIGNIAEKFNWQTDQAGEQGEEAMNNLDFFSCKENTIECRGSNLYKCKDEKWQMKEKCENGCKETACQ
jgi:uncharacterized protein YpmB